MSETNQNQQQERVQKFTFRRHIEKCPRCNGNHQNILFLPFKGTNTQWTHYSVCPENYGEPILINRVSDTEMTII